MRVKEVAQVCQVARGVLVKFLDQKSKLQDFGMGCQCQIFEFVFFIVFGFCCNFEGCVWSEDCVCAILRFFVD